MSFVTAAMLYSSRRARQSLSIRAVLPDPTGLWRKRVSLVLGFWIREVRLLERSLPTDSNCKGSFVPIPIGDDGHIPPRKRAGTVEDLMAMTVLSGTELV